MSENPFTPSILETARRHAREAYPQEACGLVVGDAYWSCENEAERPTEAFRVPEAIHLRALATGDLRGLIHSHPTGERSPSEADMAGQQASAIPWAIIPLNAEREFNPILFGDKGISW